MSLKIGIPKIGDLYKVMCKDRSYLIQYHENKNDDPKRTQNEQIIPMTPPSLWLRNSHNSISIIPNNSKEISGPWALKTVATKASSL